MGYARNHSSGDKRSWFTLRENTPKGAPVPGTGGRHGRRKGKSGSNKSGALNKLNLEWGATNRKQEDDQRGINNRARHQAVVEQLADVEAERAEHEPYRPEDGWADHLDYETIWDRESNDLWLIP